MTDSLNNIVKFIEQRDWVSFVELGKYLDHLDIPTRGEYYMEACPNACMWTGMSKEFTDIVEALRVDGRIAVDSGSEWAYFYDGRMLKYPVAKNPPKDIGCGYRTRKWLVTFFRPRSRMKPLKGNARFQSSPTRDSGFKKSTAKNTSQWRPQPRDA